MEMRFTWHPAKAERNRKLHGISFEMAEEVFGDPFHVIVENDLVDDEQRYLAIGRSRSQILITLVFVDRSKSDTIVIRIISARKATAYEEVLYLAQS